MGNKNLSQIRLDSYSERKNNNLNPDKIKKATNSEKKNEINSRRK